LDTLPVICGPTAVGKTALAVALFGRHEAVSADSMQVFRDFPVGTAHPAPAETAVLPHHLIGFLDSGAGFSAGGFFRDAGLCFSSIIDCGKRPVVVGGTGLYIKTLVSGICDTPPADQALRERLYAEEAASPGCLHRKLATLDPESAARLDPRDLLRLVRALEICESCGMPASRLLRETTRPPGYRLRIAGVIRTREEIRQRVTERASRMLAEGFAEEVDAVRRNLPEGQGCHVLGYKAVLAWILGMSTREAAWAALCEETMDLVRRQIILFRRLPGLVWYHALDLPGLRRYYDG
jgi:tRNA dimethylallyltransferase